MPLCRTFDRISDRLSWSVLYGPGVRVLPILCGPFVKSIYEGGLPEQSDRVARFLGALGDIAARESKRLFWVMGVDMAHIGRRYGDAFRAIADSGEMLQVRQCDAQRIEQINAGDASTYSGVGEQKHDDLKWCGASPLYTFLKVMPQVKGELLDYHQWQIDSQSVVTFGALRFRDR